MGEHILHDARLYIMQFEIYFIPPEYETIVSIDSFVIVSWGLYFFFFK